MNIDNIMLGQVVMVDPNYINIPLELPQETLAKISDVRNCLNKPYVVSRTILDSNVYFAELIEIHNGFSQYIEPSILPVDFIQTVPATIQTPNGVFITNQNDMNIHISNVILNDLRVGTQSYGMKCTVLDNGIVKHFTSSDIAGTGDELAQLILQTVPPEMECPRYTASQVAQQIEQMKDSGQAIIGVQPDGSTPLQEQPVQDVQQQPVQPAQKPIPQPVQSTQQPVQEVPVQPVQQSIQNVLVQPVQPSIYQSPLEELQIPYDGIEAGMMPLKEMMTLPKPVLEQLQQPTQSIEYRAINESESVIECEKEIEQQMNMQSQQIVSQQVPQPVPQPIPQPVPQPIPQPVPQPIPQPVPQPIFNIHNPGQPDGISQSQPTIQFTAQQPGHTVPTFNTGAEQNVQPIENINLVQEYAPDEITEEQPINISNVETLQDLEDTIKAIDNGAVPVNNMSSTSPYEAKFALYIQLLKLVQAIDISTVTSEKLIEIKERIKEIL